MTLRLDKSVNAVARIAGEGGPRRPSDGVGGRRAPGTPGLGDIFQRLLADVLKGKIEFARRIFLHPP